MRVFASELSRCRVFKAVFGWLAVVFGFIAFIVFPILWILQAPVEKTELDFAKEYLYDRFVFDYRTVEDAYFNRLQYQFPLYKDTVKEEIEYVKRNKIYQLFKLDTLKKTQDGQFIAQGRLVKISCKKVCERVLDEYVEIILVEPKKFKFIVQEVR